MKTNMSVLKQNGGYVGRGRILFFSSNEIEKLSSVSWGLITLERVQRKFIKNCVLSNASTMNQMIFYYIVTIFVFNLYWLVAMLLIFYFLTRFWRRKSTVPHLFLRFDCMLLSALYATSIVGLPFMWSVEPACAKIHLCQESWLYSISTTVLIALLNHMLT